MTIRLLLAYASLAVLFSCGSPANDQENAVVHTTITDTNIVTPHIEPDTVEIVSAPPIARKQVTANTNDKVVPIGIPIAEDLKSIVKPFQMFVVNNTTDTTITCKQGTIIKVKANSFVLASDPGQAASHVVVAVKEFYSLNDILSANLSTKSGDAILETGGMIYMEAKAAGGKPCILREGETVDLLVPYREQKKDMQLFYGEWKDNKVNWALSESQNTASSGTFHAFQDHAKVKEYIQKHLFYPFLDTALFINVVVKFDVAPNGRVDKVVVLTPVRIVFESMIKQVLMQMPPVRPATLDGRPVRSSADLQIIVRTGNDDSLFRCILGDIYRKDFEKTAVDSSLLNALSSSDLRRYVFSVSRLGWINIDRFLNENRPLFNYAINTGAYEDLDVKLVFSSVNSILAGNNTTQGCTFEQVPTGEKVTIVAIKKVQGIHYFATANTTISPAPYDGLQFKQVTIDGLKEQLRRFERN